MGNKRIKKESLIYLLFVLPTILYLIIFKFIPFVGNVIAFMDYKLLKGFFGSDWVGFKHFIRMFESEVFFDAFYNTLRLNLLDICIGFPFTILLSLLLVEIKLKWRNIFQTCLYIPYFISWSALGGIIVQMLSPTVGLVGAIGKLFSINNSDLPILLGQESSWIIIYVLTGIWQYAGWGTIIYVSDIMSINKNLYESAEIDGATKLQQIIHITFPLIKPTILTMFLLKIAGILSTSFEHVYALSNPMVLSVSDVLSTYEYRAGLQSMQFSYATAIGLFESIVGIIFVILARKLINKISVERNNYE